MGEGGAREGVRAFPTVRSFDRTDGRRWCGQTKARALAQALGLALAFFDLGPEPEPEPDPSLDPDRARSSMPYVHIVSIPNTLKWMHYYTLKSTTSTAYFAANFSV